MNNDSSRLTKGDVFSILVKFAVPFVLANLLQALYGAADLFVVGKFCDAASVSAVGIGSQIMFVLTGIVFGFTAGGTVIIGQYWGAGNEKDTRKTIGNMVALFALVSVVMTVIMLSFAEIFIRLMNTPKEAVEYTEQYVVVCSYGILFIVAYNVISGVLRGLGDSKTPLKFIFVACLVNICADFLFVGYFKMGPLGAAVATVLAQASAVLYVFLYFVKNGTPANCKLSDVNFSSSFSIRILKMGLPIAAQNSLVDFSFLIITVIINSMGVIASASLGVSERIIGFAMLPSASFAAAVAAMTAQNMGAGIIDRAKLCCFTGVKISFFFSMLFFIYVQFSPESLTSLFTSDLAVIKSSADYLRSFSLDCVLVSYVFNINAFFSGCGHTL